MGIDCAEAKFEFCAKVIALNAYMERVRKVVLLALLPCAAGWVSFHTPPPRTEDGKIHKLVIDAGHGGHDPGALGKKSKEKDVALAVAGQLRDILKEKMPDVEVVMTRDDDTFVDLYKRGEYVAENDADFFISIHCNSSENKQAHGTETYLLGLHAEDAAMKVMMKENKSILLEEDYQANYDGFDPTSPQAYIFFQYLAQVYITESTLLAEKIQKQIAAKEGRLDRGVKQAGFVVLWKSSSPSILVETGFISNEEEEKFLVSEDGQNFLATTLYKALKEYNEERK